MGKTIPLNDEHIRLGAKMVDFAGYIMPIQYKSGIIKEHETCRNNVGLFDLSHMGEFLVTGKDAIPFLQKMLTNDLNLLYDGKSQYACMCYENGTTIEDMFFYRQTEESFRLIINASNIEKDWNWLKEHSTDFQVKLEDLSKKRGRFALQGPLAEDTLSPLLNMDLSTLQRFHFIQPKLNGIDVFVARTGYTGEDGFEISFAVEDSLKIWRSILEEGKRNSITPVGLGARDTLRMEACYSLYGHELSDKITPVEAGIGFCVKDKENDFIGKKILLDQKKNGTTKKVVGVELNGKGIMRQNYKVYDPKDQSVEIGYVTSGTFSPTFKKALGLALLNTKYTNIGQDILIDIRGKKSEGKVVKTPFYVYHPKKEA